MLCCRLIYGSFCAPGGGRATSRAVCCRAAGCFRAKPAQPPEDPPAEPHLPLSIIRHRICFTLKASYFEKFWNCKPHGRELLTRFMNKLC
jgi:hypothetical protein